MDIVWMSALLALWVVVAAMGGARLCAEVATHSVADLTRLAVRAGLIEA